MADSSKNPNDLSNAALQAHSYTGVFKIERRIRKVNDFAVPMRGGLVPAQVGTFVAVLLVSTILWFALLNPLLHLIFGDQSTLPIAITAILGPAILAGHRIGKPMPHGKTIRGWLRSRIRRYLDDEWHRGGLPIKERPHHDTELHLHRHWTPDTEGEQYLTNLTGDNDLYTPAPIPSSSAADIMATRRYLADDQPDRLLSWVTTMATEDNTTHDDAETNDAVTMSTTRGSFGTVTVE